MAHAKGTAKITASVLNVRKGAGTEYDKLGTLTKGASVNYYGEQGGWLQIQYKSQVAYISGQYATTTPASSSGAGDNAAGGGSGQIKITADTLNVRTGSNTDSKILGTLSNGAIVDYTGTQDGWYRITYKGQTAYVSGKYATVVSAAPQPVETPVETQKPVLSTMYVTADTLNVRTGAGKDNSCIGTVSNGQALAVIGEKDGWYQINYNNGTGWVSGKYLAAKGSSDGGQTQDPGQSGSGDAPSGDIVYTTASTLNVRKAPKTGEVITQLPFATACTVKEEQNGWYKITFGSTTGWISKQYTSTTKPKATGTLQTAYEDYQNYLSNGIENIKKDNSLKSYTNEENYVISKIGQKLDVINRIAEQADLPREVVAGIWYRESSFDQTTYLHNGDPLGKETVHVPAGIYFGVDEFDKAAAHALNMKIGNKNALGLTKSSKDYAAMCAYCEAYNGYGYRSHGTASAYVSAGTSKYTGGMYVEDGVFSATTKDTRIGVMRVFQVMAENYPR